MRTHIPLASSVSLALGVTALTSGSHLATQASKASTVKLSGVYRAFPAVAQFGAAQGDAYLFTLEGGVYHGWIGALDAKEFDLSAARKKEPARTGTYSVSDDRIAFRWADGAQETYAFNKRRDNASGRTVLTIGPNFAYSIVAWNQPLAGRFSPATYQGGFPDKSQGPILQDPITFEKNGRYAAEGEDGKGVIKGTYSVRGPELRLRPDGGKERVHALHVFADGKRPPTTILLDGRPFSIR